MASSTPLLSSLPADLALLCLVRVPSLSLLWRVSPSWQAMLLHSQVFHSLRSCLGFKPQLWLYALLYDTAISFSHKSNESTDPASAHSRSAFSWHAFDPITNRWHRLPPFPHLVEFQLTSPSFIGRLHTVQCVSLHDKLFMVAGSRRGSNTRERSSEPHRLVEDALDGRPLEPALECPLIFDTQTHAWTQGAPFRVPRRWCACGTASGKLIIAGGCGKDWDVAVSKSAEMYDPENRKWVTLDHLKSSKFSGEAISAVNYEGKLHMVSGKGVFWKVGAIYDPRTGRWSDMPQGMRTGWNGPCVVVDGKLLVLEDGTGRLKVYSQSEDSWSTVMKDDMLKNMEQLTEGGPGKLCGIVRASQGCSSTWWGDVIHIVDIRSMPMVYVLHPPFGQVVALQVLSRTSLQAEDGSTE